MTDDIDQATLRQAATAQMARLDAERLLCEIPKRDLSPYAAGNRGIPYCFSFDSGRAGPHIVINALAHGNEPGGMMAVTRLIDEETHPLVGKLSFCLANIDAYEGTNGVDPYGTRFIDEDFNRVWTDAMLDDPGKSLERHRARQMRPLIATADVLLDLHATPYDARPYFLLRPGWRHIGLASTLEQPNVQIYFEQGSMLGPTIGNYRKFSDPASSAIGLSCESGLFFAAESTIVALATVARLLRHYGMIDADQYAALARWRDPLPPRKVVVLYPHMAQTTDIALLCRPADLKPAAKGDILAYDGESPVRAPFDGAILMWIRQNFEAGIHAFYWARSMDDDQDQTRGANHA